MDLPIAHDNSGSVSATENRQARDFVSQLGLAFELGITNDKSRIGISTWAAGDFYELYNNPPGVYTYTTSRADVLSYANDARTFVGWTDVYKALQKTAGWVVEDPVVGRTAPKVIVLMTDASCNQVSENIIPLATQIKNSGVYIVVMALGVAATCDDLKDTRVASPGGYFASADPSAYQYLQDNALTYITSIQTAA
ncbi:MAG: VWA domain-containing protein, partial [Sulfitobacter sp.]|nr:VWA domain-containing protein [Sulfitobacter sp.]